MCIVLLRVSGGFPDVAKESVLLLQGFGCELAETRLPLERWFVVYVVQSVKLGLNRRQESSAVNDK